MSSFLSRTGNFQVQEPQPRSLRRRLSGPGIDNGEWFSDRGRAPSPDLFLEARSPGLERLRSQGPWPSPIPGAELLLLPEGRRICRRTGAEGRTHAALLWCWRVGPVTSLLPPVLPLSEAKDPLLVSLCLQPVSPTSSRFFLLPLNLRLLHPFPPHPVHLCTPSLLLPLLLDLHSLSPPPPHPPVAITTPGGGIQFPQPRALPSPPLASLLRARHALDSVFVTGGTAPSWDRELRLRGRAPPFPNLLQIHITRRLRPEYPILTKSQALTALLQSVVHIYRPTWHIAS